ncbi:MAG TPA: hypothetical protein VGM39_10805 [Kofleriaceae bacterium]|jgi:hypothetical protein
MTKVSRIGEILLKRGWIGAELLERALAKQAASGMRTCSFLIACGAIDADTASRALGEQHGVLAVLQRHLERRDRSLAKLLPADTAQLYTALPIGRMASGEIIVCLRDPKPELRGVLMRAMKEKVVLAVAPATQLDALVVEEYGDGASEFDVDMGTQPIPVTMNLDLDESSPFQLADLDDQRVVKDHSQVTGIAMGRANTRPQVSGLHVIPRNSTPASGTPVPPPPGEHDAPTVMPGRANVHDMPTASAARSPHDTPTARAKTPNPYDAPTVRSDASMHLARTVTPSALAAAAAPPLTNPAAKVIDALARGTQPPARELAATAASLPHTIETLNAARTHDDIADAAMRFISGRWRAAMLLSVEGFDAVGLRGHGPKLTPEVARSLSISLDGPSILRSATKAPGKLLTTLPPGGDDVHDHLELLLSMPRDPAAIAVTVGSVVEYIIVTGDPHGSDMQTASLDLTRLATAIAAAYTRLDKR